MNHGCKVKDGANAFCQRDIFSNDDESFLMRGKEHSYSVTDLYRVKPGLVLLKSKPKFGELNQVILTGCQNDKLTK